MKKPASKGGLCDSGQGKELLLGINVMLPEYKREQIKLTSNYMNGLGVVTTGAGIVALPLAILNKPDLVWVFHIMSPFLVMLGFGFHFLARSFARGLIEKDTDEPK
jgi:O-antigen/teichoic acid export membrane protein